MFSDNRKGKREGNGVCEYDQNILEPYLKMSL